MHSAPLQGAATSSAKRVAEAAAAEPLVASMAVLKLGEKPLQPAVVGGVDPPAETIPQSEATAETHGENVASSVHSPPHTAVTEPSAEPPLTVAAIPEQPPLAPAGAEPIPEGATPGQPAAPALEELAASETVEPGRVLPTVVVTRETVQTAASRLQSDGLPPSPTRSSRKPHAVKQQQFFEPELPVPKQGLEAMPKQPPQAVPQVPQLPPPAIVPPLQPSPVVAPSAPAPAMPPPVKAASPLPPTAPAAPTAMTEDDKVKAVLGQLGMPGAGASGSAAPAAGGLLPDDLRALILAAQGTPQQNQPAPDACAEANPIDPNVTTATHRASAMRLSRFMESEEGAKFPHMQKMFSGTREDP